MRARFLFALTLFIIPARALCQSAPTDSQTLQALLAEVRQLRQELRTTSGAAQRAQILIYRVQAQQTIVTRVIQRLDNDRSRLSQTQSEQKRFTAAVKRLEDARGNQNDTERKQTDEQLAQMKSHLEQLSNDEQEIQPRKIELEEQLRMEQSKLAQLNDELDRIDKTLQQSALPAPNNPPH